MVKRTSKPTGRKGLGTGWCKSASHKEALCTLIPQPGKMRLRGNNVYFSFKSSRTEGVSLHKCKTESNVWFFADCAANIAKDVIADSNRNDYVVVAAPKRRHPVRNFGESVAMALADKIGARFIPDAFVAITRNRMDPQINLRRPFDDPNVIIYDDVMTTGQTLTAMEQHLKDKNIIRIIGINNTK